MTTTAREEVRREEQMECEALRLKTRHVGFRDPECATHRRGVTSVTC
jgi:hypothetical protein